MNNKKLIILLAFLLAPRACEPLDPASQILLPLGAAEFAIIAVVFGAVIIGFPTAYAVRKKQWKDRPEAEVVEKKLNSQRDRLEATMDNIKITVVPEIEKKKEEYTKTYERDLEDLMENRKDKKIPYIKYLIKKKKLKREHKSQLNKLDEDADKLSYDYVIRKWNPKINGLWSSWRLYFKKSYHKKLSDLEEFVKALEEKAKEA